MRCLQELVAYLNLVPYTSSNFVFYLDRRLFGQKKEKKRKKKTPTVFAHTAILSSSEFMATNSKIPPSARWSSYDPWNYGGMKERLESIMTKLNTATLVQHAEQVLNQKVILSKPFSAGQYWACFEMVAEDESLIIARVRLPKHPDTPAKLSEEDEAYSVGCEVATMAYIGQSLTSVKLPHVHAYEAAGSNRASALGAPYMLIEGFYGNTLQDVEFDICDLPVSVIALCILEHV